MYLKQCYSESLYKPHMRKVDMSRYATKHTALQSVFAWWTHRHHRHARCIDSLQRTQCLPINPLSGYKPDLKVCISVISSNLDEVFSSTMEAVDTASLKAINPSQTCFILRFVPLNSILECVRFCMCLCLYKSASPSCVFSSSIYPSQTIIFHHMASLQSFQTCC